jgi:methyl-accepting chemotaxis protein
MARNWTFGRKVGGGFALIVLLAVVMGVVAVYSLRSVVAAKDRVITSNAPLLIQAESLNGLEERAAANARAFLLTREERFLERLREARTEGDAALADLKRLTDTEARRRRLEAIDRARADYRQVIDRVIALRRTPASLEAVSRFFDDDVLPKRDALAAQLKAFTTDEEKQLDTARQAATDSATFASTLVVVMLVLVVILAALIAFVLTRTLGRQIGTAIAQVQSSSAELQAAASQQATAAKEQATAMSEISTTISELLASSRQIADGAQRVAGIAGQTATAARAGDGTVATAHDSIAGIRRQVDLVVTHMLELGKKSQQIGAVLDIVSELAEQTNILAINATIEAAGAGDAGRRFAVVAEEIRKLADRVAGSTKEIRGLIDDVRGAVNTTVMATESGSKSVDAGSRQFGDVASALKDIGALVGTTTEAAREIELSTKQQSTAVEQVNVAIASVAQATKETEASSGQTLQTAVQLAGLSRDLLRIVQPQGAA